MAPENKNVDGIRKLEGKELERSRKIVLDYIGEKDKSKDKKMVMPEVKRDAGKPPVSIPGSQARRFFDGVIGPSKLTVDQAKVKQEKKADNRVKISDLKKGFDIISQAAKKVQRKPDQVPGDSVPAKAEAVKKEIIQPKPELKKEEVVPSEPSKEELEKKVRAEEEERQRAEEEERRLERAKKKQEKIEQKTKKKEEIIKNKEAKVSLKQDIEAKKQIAKDRAAKEKMVKRFTLKEKREKIKNQREFDKARRASKRRLLIINIKNKIKSWFISIKESGKKTVGAGKKAGKALPGIILFLAVLIVFLYSIYALLVIKFNFYNEISPVIAKYVPVPVAIAKIGFIEYSDFTKIKADVKKSISNEEEARQEVRAKVTEEIIIKSLAKKYKVSYQVNSENVRQALTSKLMLGGDTNKVAYSRINKIFKLINEGEDFDEVGRQYGDKQGYVNKEEKYNLIQVAMKDMASGQVSDISISVNGYNIFKKDGEKIKYIFVKSVSLDEYVDNMKGRLRVWILAK